MSSPNLDWCSECETLSPIVNKHFKLCDTCNYKRTHHGKNRHEVARERHEKRHKDKVSQVKLGSANNKRPLAKIIKKLLSIKKVSSKKIERDKLMKITYAKIDSTRDPVCEGCDRGDVILSHSHILSQAKRPDLAAEIDNIRLHCFGNHYGCHEIWERGEPSELIQMNDFKENLAYIELMDKEEYRKILIDFESSDIDL